MRKLGLGCPILVFTTHQSDTLAKEVRKAGAQGLVAKSQPFRDLVRAIEALLAGGTFFDGPLVAQKPKPEEPKTVSPVVWGCGLLLEREWHSTK